MTIFRSLLSFFVGRVSRYRVRTPIPRSTTLELVVASRSRRAATDAVTLVLRSNHDGPLPLWTPGAHIRVTLPSGRVRNYSLCGLTSDRYSYSITVRIRPDSAATREIDLDVQPGTQLQISHPRNNFPFANPMLGTTRTHSVVFIAGGIGITALKPMIEEAVATGVPWQLTYFGRNEESMPFLTDLSPSSSPRVTVLTTEVHGRPTARQLTSQVQPGCSVYYCGPSALLGALRAATVEAGAGGFHFERFDTPVVVSGSPFDLHLSRSGRTLTIPADRSALAVALETNPATPYACRQGFCGSCRVHVSKGRIEQRGHSSFLAEPDTMLLCVDRAADDALTIDL
ncbi:MULTISPECIES: PDR/VanB family oxidoreductase [Nocardiaceae]|uniref:PDR/VanB family oxidoreductase n=1 Tax=Nocardiaceae TaxID=85025 RepID=UPI0005230B02|nr:MULTISPECIES: PDR/VanB family oxidoreductase [Rhodococcus]